MTQALDANTLDGLTTFAERLADAAKTVILPHFRTPVQIDHKPDATPVTIADRTAEAAMRALIAETYPDHGIVGEEEEDVRPDADFVWVLDPVDGTKRFITGNPCFGTLVALLREGTPIVGIIDMPALAERWVGALGNPTLHQTRDGRKAVKSRPCPTLGDAYLYSTSPGMFVGEDNPRFAAVSEAARVTLYGSECYGYGLLASGYADLVIEADMAVYDYLAHVPVVTGSGGVMSDWEGAPLTIKSGHKVLAAGDPKCHAAAVEHLKSTL